MKWLFWRERIEPGKTTIIGCSDAYFTMTAAFFVVLIGGSLFVPIAIDLGIGTVLPISLVVASVTVLLPFLDRFRLEISADGYRLRYYVLGIFCRQDTEMPPQTKFSLFMPDWDEESDRFAVGFFVKDCHEILAWLYYPFAGDAESRLRVIAGRYGLEAGKFGVPGKTRRMKYYSRRKATHES